MKTYNIVPTELKENQIFVFGSNLQGFHGAGSAGYASFNVWGNRWREFEYDKRPNGWRGKWNIKGVGLGLQRGTGGVSYALPTVTSPGHGNQLGKNSIIYNISMLYTTADALSDFEFIVSYSGDTKKNLNGYTSVEMAEMFSANPIPDNIIFEEKFYMEMSKNNIKFKV